MTVLHAVYQFLTSRVKWAKLKLLVCEQILMARYSIRRAVSLPLNDQSADLSAPEKSDSQSSELRADHRRWVYESRLRIAKPVLSSAGTRYLQDKLQPDGVLHTDFTYQCAVYHQASFYSNGTSHVSLFDRLGKRVVEFSYAKYDFPVPSTLRLPATIALAGTSLSLYGNVENTAGNLGHWSIDGISRLFMALKFYSLDEIDHVIVPGLRYGFQKESLLSLGIQESKIVELDVLDCVKCERLIVTTAPRDTSSTCTPGWIVDGFRKSLLPAKASVSAGKRIYISRRDAGSRKFLNEEEIIHCLEGFGFEAVQMSDYDFDEKIALFAQAEVIVGLTGAGMTNMMLCPPDATILELFPASYVTYFYASMASYLGLDYQYLIFDNQSMLSSLNKYYGNLTIDTHLLKNKVSEMMRSRGAF